MSSYKERKNRRLSKREVEGIVLEKHADLFGPLAAPNNSLSTDATDEMTRYLNGNPEKKGNGTFRLLTSRMILKKSSSPWTVKPRILSVPYNQLRQVHQMPDRREVLALGIDADEMQEARYEFIKFDKESQATEVLNRIKELGYGDGAENNFVPLTNVDETRSVTPDAYNNASATKQFEGDAEFRQFDMRLFSEFPSQLPLEVTESLQDTHLDEKGVLAGYEDGVILRSTQAEDSDKLWSTNFNRVSRLYVDEQTGKQQYIFTVDDDMNKPNHYNLVRMSNNNRDYERLVQTYRDRGGDVRTVNFAEHSRRSSPDRRYTPDPVAIRQASPDYVKSMPYERSYNQSQENGHDTYYSQQQESSHETYYSQHDVAASGFTSSRLANQSDRRAKLMTKPSVASKNELNYIPQDGSKWDVDCATVHNDPSRGVEMDDEGSVVLFVARKMA